MSKTFAEDLGTSIRITDPVNLQNAQVDSKMIGHKAKNVEIIIDTMKFCWDVLVAPISESCILGMDFLKTFSCIINLDKNEVTIDSRPVLATLRKDTYGRIQRISRVSIRKRQTIPPTSFTNITASMDNPSPSHYVIQPMPGSCVEIASVLIQGRNEIPVRVANTSHRYVTLKPGMHLAIAYEAECVLDEHPDKATSDDSDARDPLQNSSNVERNNEASSSHPDEDDMKTTRIFDNKLLKAPSVRNVALQREDPDNILKTPTNTDSEVPNHLQPLISSASQNLCGRQLKAFQQVITEYSDVFSKHDFRPRMFQRYPTPSQNHR